MGICNLQGGGNSTESTCEVVMLLGLGAGSHIKILLRTSEAISGVRKPLEYGLVYGNATANAGIYDAELDDGADGANGGEAGAP